jgi:hypothetical protein
MMPSGEVMIRLVNLASASGPAFLASFEGPDEHGATEELVVVEEGEGEPLKGLAREILRNLAARPVASSELRDPEGRTMLDRAAQGLDPHWLTPAQERAVNAQAKLKADFYRRYGRERYPFDAPSPELPED